jgi:asparagine synthase (glutamine-hydrolysing)
MPGLVGYTDKRHRHGEKMIPGMQKLMKYFDWYIDDRIFSDERICASRTHLGIINQGSQPFNANNRFYSWLEGEFYNQDELKATYDVSAGNDNELLLNIYIRTRSFEFLRNVDGYYAAVIYDKVSGIVYLITDRYGFKPLYWSLINGSLIWTSELKGFLAHADFKIKIDVMAVEQFFDVGYLLENRTWFDGVELMPPAAVLEFNISESAVKVSHYWSWSDVKQFKGIAKESEIVEELGRLFKQSVIKRVNKDERIGITLSGGLDSRAILAAVPDDYRSMQSFTFGQNGCHDLLIAKRAALIKKTIHHEYFLHHNNWLLPRVDKIWIMDGLINLLHLHGCEFYGEMKKYIDINLSGFLGDAILGGSYLSAKETLEYRVRNRGRRFINQALELAGAYIMQRKPFFDNELFELILSIPERMRANSKIYNKMLLITFKEYFISIPWQKTGFPISYPVFFMKPLVLSNRMLGRLKRGASSIGIKTKDLRNYTDYAAWIRHEPARSFFENVLLDKNAIYPAYINKANIHNQLQDHLLNKANYDDELCLTLTFEIWLQQIFMNRYRDRIL